MDTKTITLNEAQTYLAALMATLKAGEEILIVRDKTPLAKLVAPTKTPERSHSTQKSRMTTITLELPDEISLNFNNINEIRQTLYEDFIIEQRQRGNISLGRAAKLLGLTYSEFFNLLGKKGLSFINATPDELEESYQHFEKMMEQVNQ